MNLILIFNHAKKKKSESKKFDLVIFDFKFLA